MSLNGLTVAVTGSRRASELAHLISNMGGIPYVAPTVGIVARSANEANAESFIKTAGEVDYVVFMTGPGVFTVMEMAEKLNFKDDLIQTLKKKIVVGRSQKPKAALQKFGITAQLVPADTHDNTAAGIAKEMLKHDLKGKKVAVLWHGLKENILKEKLEKAGAKVSDFQVYDYSLTLSKDGAKVLSNMGFEYVEPDEKKVVKLIEDMSKGKIHVITFTSPPSARNLFVIAKKHDMNNVLKKAIQNVIVVAVGLPTATAIQDNGVKVDVVPDVYKMGPMMKALAEYVQKHPIRK
ncbi:MAG: uroporphyrinogen-III synthase [Thaumarchaeota archaeon]|nr:uroporphyrinogen-III synthase [Nitrososphaerota archaeon]